MTVRRSSNGVFFWCVFICAMHIPHIHARVGGAASWDPRWNIPSTPTGQRLLALLAVLEAPSVRLEEVFDALCGLWRL